MLNINLECSRAYARHFQSYNSCYLELMLNTKSHNSCAPELVLNTKSNRSCVPDLAFNTKYHHSCALGSMPNTLQNSIMHSVFYTFYHNNHLSICIEGNHIIFVHMGACPTYTISYIIIKCMHKLTSNIYLTHVKWGLTLNIQT